MCDAPAVKSVGFVRICQVHQNSFSHHVLWPPCRQTIHLWMNIHKKTHVILFLEAYCGCAHYNEGWAVCGFLLQLLRGLPFV